MQAKHFSMCIAVVAILVTLLFSLTASARVGFGHSGRLMSERVAAMLELSDSQRAQLQSLFASYRETTRLAYEQLREKRKALAEFSKAETFDESGVQSLAQEIAAQQAEITVNRARLAHEALAILTPGQRAKLDELHEQRIQRLKEWRERHSDRLDKQQG